MWLDEQNDRSRKDDIGYQSGNCGKVTETTITTNLETEAMNTEANRTDDSEQVDFVSWVRICLVVSLAANIFQAVNSVRATCQHSAPGPRVLNQNIVNVFYNDNLVSKTPDENGSN